jgi:phosphatidylserine decarboxylase
VFNVHVNRAPIGGEIEVVKYNPGRFHIASVDKASLENEQIGMVIRDGNRKLLVKQIAGFIARRVICYVKPGDVIKKGDRYGLIRFGSRADIFLPKDAEIKVKLGDRVKGARDIIGLLKSEASVLPSTFPTAADGISFSLTLSLVFTLFRIYQF